MAHLVPHDFDVDAIGVQAERRVVQRLLAGLSDEWLVVPTVPLLVDGRNAEIDVVLVSANHGVVLVETKGGVISIRGGAWYSYDHKLRQSPFEQLTKARHALVRRLRQMNFDLRGIYINTAVAMPDVGAIPDEGLGPDAPREHCWGGIDLDAPDAAVSRLCREVAPVSPGRIAALVQHLRPDIEIRAEDGRYVDAAGRRIDGNTRHFLRALHGLDVNDRFLVLGAAGTGKTVLARRWAERAVERGERTLLVCFNKPLADDFSEAYDDALLTTGTFQGIALQLVAPFGVTVPEGADQEWWRRGLVGELVASAPRISGRFDTIIVDEGQDFASDWIAALEALLDPSGPRRMLIVADPGQAIYEAEWNPPAAFPRVTLPLNLRNTREVARAVAQLGGAEPNELNPKGVPIRRATATVGDVVSVVRGHVDHAMSELGIAPAHIAVLVRHRSLQQALLDSGSDPYRFVEWEQRSEDSVLCETIHRTKGLERRAVVVVDLDEVQDPTIRYVAWSRSTMLLVVVGPATSAPPGIRTQDLRIKSPLL